MNGDAVPLQLFGPQALYRWLYYRWPDLDAASQKCLADLHRHLVSVSSEHPQGLPRLAATSEYERALTALSESDFESFIDACLSHESWPPNWRSVQGLGFLDLKTDVQELRQQLILAFSRERIWPRHGLRSVAAEALRAARQAADALPFAAPNVAFPLRRRAILKVHEGVDRALLRAERLLELLIEFMTLCLLSLRWATPEQGEEWLAAIDLPGNAVGTDADQSKRKNKPMWHEKQRILGAEAANLFWEIPPGEGQELMDSVEPFRQPESGWEPVWPHLRRLVESCGLRQADGKWVATGPIMEALDEIRDIRNRIRHAQDSLHEGQQVPPAYVQAIPDLCGVLVDLHGLMTGEPAIPYNCKVLGILGDCYGACEVVLALETGQEIAVRYIHKQDLETLAGYVEQGMALAQREYEFFLLPPSELDQGLLVNPLLLRRDYDYRDLGCVPINDSLCDREVGDHGGEAEVSPETIDITEVA